MGIAPNTPRIIAKALTVWDNTAIEGDITSPRSLSMSTVHRLIPPKLQRAVVLSREIRTLET